ADGGAEIEVEVAPEHARYLTSKGSATLDGVSLTVVRPAGRRFRVALIPETLARTTLGEARAGQALHFEADLIGKWVERFVRERD
ncbi:MAG TPA: riboflavin synthase, partial [Planctomycetota bacterium]|nr:riboflavin synthase [Planctomycetota bacterium]